MKNLAWLLAALICATLLLALAACGGDDDDDDDSDGDSPAHLTENAVAEAMLLVLEDLPAEDEWAAAPDEPDPEESDNPIARCDRGDPPGTIGKADGDEFSRQDGTSVEQTVRIFESEDHLNDAINTFEEIADCVGELVDEGDLDDEEVAFSNFQFSDLDFPEFGDRTRAYRLSLTLTEIDPADGVDPVSGEVYLDLVYVAIGTAGTRVMGSGIFEPYPPGELADVVALAEDKMRRVLSGDIEPTPTSDDEETDEPEETGGPTSTGGGLSTQPPAETARPSGPGSAPEQPISFGDTGTLLNAVELRVLDVDFDAEDDVVAFNSTNVATPGKNMIVITVEVTNNGEAPLDTFFDLFWNLIGEKGIAYNEFDPSCGSVEGELDGELTTGQSKTGTVCVQADEDDSNIVFFVEMFNDNFDLIPTYFALQ